jgi:endonuclease/exonuclease/phosphatase family metal-dependent hydrolase
MIKVISLNIRYDNTGDSLNQWSDRAPIICNLINNEKPDIFGLQEVLYSQYGHLDSLLPDYGSAGVGRTDGIREGEMNPVYYLKERFDMIRNKTFWLSETPERPGSVSWESSLPRIVTWMELSAKDTHEHFFVFNTHFAHDSDSARIMSSHLLLSKIDSIASGFPFIITGDFNMLHSSKGYAVLTGPFESIPLINDTYAIAERRHTGPAYTYNGFSEKSSGGRIDYIFIRNGMKAMENRTLIRKEHGIYISDHWPVMAVVSLKMPDK